MSKQTLSKAMTAALKRLVDGDGIRFDSAFSRVVCSWLTEPTDKDPYVRVNTFNALRDKGYIENEYGNVWGVTQSGKDAYFMYAEQEKDEDKANE